MENHALLSDQNEVYLSIVDYSDSNVYYQSDSVRELASKGVMCLVVTNSIFRTEDTRYTFILEE